MLLTFWTSSTQTHKFQHKRTHLCISVQGNRALMRAYISLTLSRLVSTFTFPRFLNLETTFTNEFSYPYSQKYVLQTLDSAYIRCGTMGVTSQVLKSGNLGQIDFERVQLYNRRERVKIKLCRYKKLELICYIRFFANTVRTGSDFYRRSMGVHGAASCAEDFVTTR